MCIRDRSWVHSWPRSFVSTSQDPWRCKDALSWTQTRKWLYLSQQEKHVQQSQRRQYVFNRRNYTKRPFCWCWWHRHAKKYLHNMYLKTFGYSARSLSSLSLSLSLSLLIFLNEMMWTLKYAPGLLSLQKHSISVKGIKTTHRPKKNSTAPPVLKFLDPPLVYMTCQDILTRIPKGLVHWLVDWLIDWLYNCFYTLKLLFKGIAKVTLISIYLLHNTYGSSSKI